MTANDDQITFKYGLSHVTDGTVIVVGGIDTGEIHGCVEYDTAHDEQHNGHGAGDAHLVADIGDAQLLQRDAEEHAQAASGDTK